MTHAGYFEGIGGFSLGAERAGIETVYTCEIDEFRHTWLKHYLQNATHEKDIKNATGMYADIFTAGFPCQDISIANPKGKGINGERSGLFFEFFKFVDRYKPGYVVLENSPMLLSLFLNSLKFMQHNEPRRPSPWTGLHLPAQRRRCSCNIRL